jgi:wyosine [tRNA(Phe)-imidazoG37] synthetase (radical SAM superfamily)
VSHRQIQDTNSTMCGYYCLMCDCFMTHEKQGRDIYERFDDFLNLFKVDTNQNDQIVKNYLKGKGIVL